jgi:hypothetical protein
VTRLAAHAVSAWAMADAASKGFRTEGYTTADISSLCIFFSRAAKVEAAVKMRPYLGRFAFSPFFWYNLESKGLIRPKGKL